MKNRVMIVLLVATAMVVFLFGTYKPVHSKENIVQFSYSNFFPAGHFISNAAEAWTREIEKRTGGRVKITMHHSGTLTSATACYEGVVRNISDIGLSCLAYTPGRFPLMEVIDLPGYPFTPRITCRIAQDLYMKFKPKELTDTHVLYLYAHIPGGIVTRDKPVRNLEELKGLRIRCTGLSAKIVQLLGATPVGMSKGEQYEALQRGVVDGSTIGPNELIYYKVAEVAKFLTLHSPVGYVTAFFNVMNLKKWNSLPPDIQKIFTEVSEEWVEYVGKAWESAEIEGIQFGKKKGITYFVLSPEEGARWEKALKPIFDAYLKDMETKGLPGKEVLEYRQKLIEKYRTVYPALKVD